MNAMDAVRSMLLAVADEPLLGRLFLASVEMAVLAALVWLAIRARVIRPARWQSFLWLIVLVKPFMVVALGALVPVFHFDVAAPPTMAAPAPVPLPAEASVEMRAVESPAVPHSASPAQIPQSEPSVPATPIARQSWNLPTLLVRVWLLGIVLLGAYAAIDRFRLWRLVAHAQPASPELATKYARLAEALHIKRPPRLRITDALESPALAGLLRPTILIPAWLVHEQESDKLDWSLRHELTHWKLGDVWAHAAQQLAQIVFFFNPVTWWACRRWQEAAELACDRAVVETEHDVEVYADNLYQVLAQIHGQRRGLLAGGLFATRTQIGRRIAVLLSNPLKYPARLGTTGIIVLFCVAAISLSVGASFASGEQAVASNVTAPHEPAVVTPFSVFGIVTDEDGRPLPGVQVTAHCGMGTLMPTGETISGPDGRYTLYFGPGMHQINDSGGTSVGLQAATIRAGMPGRYEKNLCRHGGLGMAGELPKEEPGWPASRDMIVLPDKPYRLDFIMLPAAQVRVRLVDAQGKAIVGRRMNVAGPEIGPSASVLAGLTTDERGIATFDAPCKTYWFELPSESRDALKSEPVTFEAPGPYDLTLAYDPNSVVNESLKLTGDARPSSSESSPIPQSASAPVAEDSAAKSLIPQGSVLLTHTDSTAEGKWSLSASGHAIRFERGAQHFLEAVQIAASRYGSPEPPAEDFHLYVLNDIFQIVADVPFPYAMIERSDFRWYTLRTPSIEVPETFYITLAFNPHKTKGVYLAYDANIEASHSYRGLPDSGYEPEDERHDWMIRAYLSAEPSGEKGVQRLADWSPPKNVEPFEGLVEAKYDDGVSDGKQSYGGAGPYIRYAATTWAMFLGRRVHSVPDTEALVGLRVYGSRYGSGYDAETTMLHVIIQDPDGKEVAKADFPYSLFSYKERWVDLVLPEPVMSGTVDEFTCILDPEAHQTKGIYFHYKKNPAESHSGVAKSGKADKPTPDREWMIRAYFRR
ncbi:MAG: hypothetical protein IT365_24085 [Candidatus Hydrogenedentes bacterium]|nr:hypothetical protein [Candidatus Hydrogenedentota bacterium]